MSKEEALAQSPSGALPLVLEMLDAEISITVAIPLYGTRNR